MRAHDLSALHPLQFGSKSWNGSPVTFVQGTQVCVAQEKNNEGEKGWHFVAKLSC